MIAGLYFGMEEVIGSIPIRSPNSRLTIKHTNAEWENLHRDYLFTRSHISSPLGKLFVLL
jgi:hypothetical protein